jgi:hypothetical protein
MAERERPPDRNYYISVEVDLFTHPKILTLGEPRAFRYLRAVAWSHRHLTDGYIPRAAATELRLSPNDVSAFVKGDLWEVASGGWRIHDYLAHQPSRAQMRRRSDAGRNAAGIRWAMRSASEPHSGSQSASRADRNADAVPSQSESYSSHVTRDVRGGQPEAERQVRYRDQDAEPTIPDHPVPADRTNGLRPPTSSVDRVLADARERVPRG